MAYTPIGWQTGDTITAEKMNKMDNGWGVETSGGVLFNETVTTVDDGGIAWGELQYSEQITADTVTITFNNVEYVCNRVESDPGVFAYGGLVDADIDFSTFPFVIFSDPSTNEIATENAGTFTIKAESTTSTIEVSDDFSQACNACVDTSTMPMLCVSGTTTYEDMDFAMRTGHILYFIPYSTLANTRIITQVASDSVVFIPTDSSISVSFVDGIFTVTPVA